MAKRSEKKGLKNLPTKKLSAESVRGGSAPQSVTLNKAKTADKQFQQMDAYLKG